MGRLVFGGGRGIPVGTTWVRLSGEMVCAKKSSSPGFECQEWVK